MLRLDSSSTCWYYWVVDVEREAWLRRATRYRILLAAETCFAATGFDGARVEDVAGMAGVSKSHLYYHFASKQELLSCLVELRTFDMLADKDELFAAADLGALVADTAELERLLGAGIDRGAGSTARLHSHRADRGHPQPVGGRPGVRGA